MLLSRLYLWIYCKSDYACEHACCIVGVYLRAWLLWNKYPSYMICNIINSCTRRRRIEKHAMFHILQQTRDRLIIFRVFAQHRDSINATRACICSVKKSVMVIVISRCCAAQCRRIMWRTCNREWALQDWITWTKRFYACRSLRLPLAWCWLVCTLSARRLRRAKHSGTRITLNKRPRTSTSREIAACARVTTRTLLHRRQ